MREKDRQTQREVHTYTPENRERERERATEREIERHTQLHIHRAGTEKRIYIV